MNINIIVSLVFITSSFLCLSSLFIAIKIHQSRSLRANSYLHRNQINLEEGYQNSISRQSVLHVREEEGKWEEGFIFEENEN